MFRLVCAIALVAGATAERFNEVKYLDGHTVRNSNEKLLPRTYLKGEDLPKAFTWGDVDGVSYLTHSLNQHVPQYCGSCWAHGSVSALADRIKIARKAQGEDINLSIQYILNCAGEVAGSCHGGSHSGTYQFIHDTGFIPFDTCMPYMACSEESTEGFCEHVDTTCSAINTCRTCDTFAGNGGACAEIDYFPNATVAEYGVIQDGDVDAIKAEIFARGPVAATINAEPIVGYKGGIFTDDTAPQYSNHIVSIVGWGYDEDENIEYWVIRNSWGVYWGEMGYVRVETGKNILAIEEEIAWATPGIFTINNVPCSEDGSSCGKDVHVYQDPSTDLEAVQRRVDAHKPRKIAVGTIRATA
uniref:Peptidase C1A papain C-terminal domain-containing protein n=1 Tax=Attheya septentrionalis TaxID=420275 RepID=A0A7S2XRN5_9STRA|mmetsp:Transcript_3349/g.6095  ORF Transcript_3349/g.6095 Transcript_3349/m.6095 type:complete len:357 (+) Transcript_3349:88-1158(+)